MRSVTSSLIALSSKLHKRWKRSGGEENKNSFMEIDAFLEKIKRGYVAKWYPPQKANDYKLKRSRAKKEWNSHFKSLWEEAGNGKAYLSYPLVSSIVLRIEIPRDYNDFDFRNHIRVYDVAEMRYYMPFYGDNYKTEVSDFPFLQKTIIEYNRQMDNFPFFTRL